MSDSVFLDGQFVEAAGAVSAADRGLLVGDGVFDTALVLGGTVFRRNEHIDRLIRAADSLAIPIARRTLEAAYDALAKRQIDGSIRLTLTRGPAPRGLSLPDDPNPTLLGSSAPLAPAIMFKPMRIAVSPIRRNETSPTSRLKSLSYLDAILANRDASREGADEALFLNMKGRPACSALANLFVLSGDTLATPPLEDGVLDGILRRWILARSSDFGFSACERPIEPSELGTANLFLTNSLRLISPAVVDCPAAEAEFLALIPIMEGLCSAIGEECGVDPRSMGAALPSAPR